MKNELQTTLNSILNDKNVNLKPENLKQGVTCLGVDGTLSASSKGLLYYADKEEMNADTTQADGTICIVGMKDIDKTDTSKPTVTILELPEIIPVEGITETSNLIEFRSGWINVYPSSIEIVVMDFSSGMVGQATYNLYTKQGENYVRESSLGVLCPITKASGGLDIGDRASFNHLDNKLYDYIKFKSSDYTNQYIYNGNSKKWEQLPNAYDASADNLQIGKKALSKNGVITGTLDLTKNINTFLFRGFYGGTLAEKVQSGQIEDLQMSEWIWNNITNCPNIAGNKYFLLNGYVGMDMGGPMHIADLFVTSDLNATITIDENCNITSNCETWTRYEMSAVYVSNPKQWNDFQYIPNQTFKQQGEPGPLTFPNIYDMYLLLYMGSAYLSTNCKFIHSNGKTICEANGPEKTAIGSFYTNIKGELIPGIMQSGLDTSDATATVNDIAEGKTAYVNGEKIEGTLTDNNSIITLVNQDNITAKTGDNYFDVRSNIGTDTIVRANSDISIRPSFEKIAEAIGLTADKIKKGETILGITGTYTGTV